MPPMNDKGAAQRRQELEDRMEALADPVVAIATAVVQVLTSMRKGRLRLGIVESLTIEGNRCVTLELLPPADQTEKAGDSAAFD